jgi:hypothetical protein
MQVPLEGGEEGTTSSIVCPMVMRSTWREYCGLVEHTAYMGISKKGSRFLQFESAGPFYAKTRASEKLDKFEPANLLTIFNKLKG